MILFLSKEIQEMLGPYLGEPHANLLLKEHHKYRPQPDDHTHKVFEHLSLEDLQKNTPDDNHPDERDQNRSSTRVSKHTVGLIDKKPQNPNLKKGGEQRVTRHVAMLA